MRELHDYSDDFRPDLKMEDFSKEALVRAWYAASKMYIGMYGFWLSLVREELGDQKAWELGMELWKRIVPHEIRWVSEAMRIKGNDVATYFKVWQVDPGFRGIGDLEFDLKNKNHGILTVRRCLSLEYAERHRDEYMQKLGCEADVREFTHTAQLFHPNMKATALKLPPRKSQDEVACQWEIKIEG